MTRVQSGGRGGSGGYTVGLRFMSHGWVLRGLVLMWCAVAFFFGLDEHSITNPPPPIPIGIEPPLPLLTDERGGATATRVPNMADTDMLLYHLCPSVCGLICHTPSYLTLSVFSCVNVFRDSFITLPFVLLLFVFGDIPYILSLFFS